MLMYQWCTVIAGSYGNSIVCVQKHAHLGCLITPDMKGNNSDFVLPEISI